MKEISEKYPDWGIFIKRMAKKSPIATKFMIDVSMKLQEAWIQTNPDVGLLTKGEFWSDEKCKIHSTKLFYLFMGILAEEINNSIIKSVMTKEEFKEYDKKMREEAEKISEETAKKITSEGLIFEAELNKIECKKCGFWNNIENEFCGKCKEKMDK